MGKMNEYFAHHVSFNSSVHVCMGLGIAWLLAMIWQGYSVLSLVLGIVFIVIAIAGHFYVQFAE